MAEANQKIRFILCTQTEYDTATTKNANAFYYITDKNYLAIGNNILTAPIDIPVDKVIQSGEYVESKDDGTTGPFLKLTIANVTNPIYINVKDLVESTVSVAQTQTSGIEIATITIDGKDTKIFAPVAENIDLTGYVKFTEDTSEVGNFAIWDDAYGQGLYTSSYGDSDIGEIFNRLSGVETRITAIEEQLTWTNINS